VLLREETITQRTDITALLSQSEGQRLWMASQGGCRPMYSTAGVKSYQLVRKPAAAPQTTPSDTLHEGCLGPASAEPPPTWSPNPARPLLQTQRHAHSCLLLQEWSAPSCLLVDFRSACMHELNLLNPLHCSLLAVLAHSMQSLAGSRGIPPLKPLCTGESTGAHGV
jgi:hypothetical protein